MINAYEVELRVTNKNTKSDRLVIRTEHAYSVYDAVMQATFNQSAEYETGSADIVLKHVGPPAMDIAQASAAMASALSDALSRIRQKATTK